MSGSVWDPRCAHWPHPPEAEGCCSSSPLKEDSIIILFIIIIMVTNHNYIPVIMCQWPLQRDSLGVRDAEKSPVPLFNETITCTHTHTHTLVIDSVLFVLPVRGQVLFSPLHDSALNSSGGQVTSQHATAAQKQRQAELPSGFRGPDPELETGLRTNRTSVTSSQSWASEKEQCHYL